MPSFLFPVKDILRTLAFGIREYKLKPLLDARGIHHYYSLLKTVLTSDAVVIHAPLQSTDNFEAHKIKPFSFTVNGAIMTLDLPLPIVLIFKDVSLYLVNLVSDLLKCKTKFMFTETPEVASCILLNMCKLQSVGGNPTRMASPVSYGGFCHWVC